MKNTAIYGIIILLFALGACNKDDAEDLSASNALSIKITNNIEVPYIVATNDEISFDISILIESSKGNTKANLSLNGQELSSSSSASTEEIVLKYEYKVKANDAGQSLIFRLKVTDEEGNSIYKDYTVYVKLTLGDIGITMPDNVPSEIKDNESVAFNIAFNSTNDLKQIKTYLNDEEIKALTMSSFDDAKDVTYPFSYTPTSQDADKTLLFTIEAIDVIGNIVRKEYSLQIIRSQEVDYKFYPDLIIGANNTIDYGPFLNLVNGVNYKVIGSASVSDKIDIACYYGNSAQAFILTSPTFTNLALYVYTVALYKEDGVANWAVKNSTTIKKVSMTAEEFNQIQSSDKIQELYTNSSITGSNTSDAISVGDALLIKTQANKYGVIYVKLLTNKNYGWVTFDLKTQK